MHGMAFDAEIKGSTAGRIYYSDGSFESRKDLYVYYVQHPEIKVINNSWGTGCYLTNIDDNQAYELVQSGVLTPTATRNGRIIFIIIPYSSEKRLPMISF